MKTLLAARVHKYGGPDVVRVEQTSLHGPRAGELQVRIHAAGVNSIDWRIRAGYFQLLKAPALPFTLGGDFSGVVEAVGPGSGGFKVGAEVYGQATVFAGGSGSFAESAIAPAATVALKPRSMSHIEACTLPTAGTSALECLTKYLRISVGQKVLIKWRRTSHRHHRYSTRQAPRSACRDDCQCRAHQLREKLRRGRSDRLYEPAISRSYRRP